jgi:hypothetical protein
LCEKRRTRDAGLAVHLCGEGRSRSDARLPRKIPEVASGE